MAEEELRGCLAGAAEVGIGLDGAGLVTAYKQQAQESRLTGDPFMLASTVPLLRVIPGAATLPLRDGPNSILSPQAAAELDLLSRKLRVYLNAIAPLGPDGQPRDLKRLRERMRADLRDKKPEWLRAAAVPALNQLLMAQDAPTRGLLVELLAQIPERPATVALAHRAAFDLAPEVRDAATEALNGRDPEVWRPVFVKALGYPWPPPADFAAEALIKLRAVGAIPELVVLLGKPQPGLPVTLPNKAVVIREVVKVNHLRNCMLCHPPALRGNEPVVGVDPVWNNDVFGTSRDPAVSQARLQSSLLSGKHDYGVSANSPPVLIRGDITFLWQDFAVSFPVAGQQPLRFDYVVRTRRVGQKELAKWQALRDDRNPQRDAALLALRELTGKDHGGATEAWVKAYPRAEAEVRSTRLLGRLLRAEPMARLGVIQEYLAGKGVEYTWALARAIPRLSGPAQQTARLALAQRLAQAPDELRERLDDRDPEIRRAAALASERNAERVSYSLRDGQ